MAFQAMTPASATDSKLLWLAPQLNPVNPRHASGALLEPCAFAAEKPAQSCNREKDLTSTATETIYTKLEKNSLRFAL
jgi:hypothetical protein